MKFQKIFIIVLLVALVVLLAGWRLSEYFSTPTPESSVQTDSTPEPESEEPQEPILKFDKTAASSQEASKIRLAVSADGQTFLEDDPIIEGGSSPDVTLLADGRMAIYANDTMGRSNSGIMVSFSEDGENWESGSVQLDSLKTGGKDPDVVVLPNGKIRLYMVQTGKLNSDTTETTKVVSAVSSDGINFTTESGTRLAEEGISEPDVIQIGDEWVMYYTQDTKVIMARSSNGLTFELEKTIRNRGTATSTAKTGDDKYRQFYCDSGIKSSTSADGSSWKAETGYRLELEKDAECSPGLLNIEGDSWLMYYSSDEES